MLIKSRFLSLAALILLGFAGVEAQNQCGVLRPRTVAEATSLDIIDAQILNLTKRIKSGTSKSDLVLRSRDAAHP